MPYRFAQERQDYRDFAGGQVFVTAPGQPGFPVRLASELFQCCSAIRKNAGLNHPVTIYDPCCGSAALLSTLAYLHGQDIRQIIGSDVEEKALELARRNLSLTTPEGLEARIAELQTLHQRYGKESHAASLESARRLQGLLAASGAEQHLPFRLFRADATRQAELNAHIREKSIDIVITDLPYGQLCLWQTGNDSRESGDSPVVQMLDALRPLLAEQAVLAVATDKQQKVAHPAYRRREQFQVGKRRLFLLQPLA